MPKVHIVNPNIQYINMFLMNGWETTDSIQDADLVQFTGGHDVSPELYGQVKHFTTSSNPARDAREARIFRAASKMGKPLAGICRGGQFLNVMCGGSMFQHVDNHAISAMHDVIDTRSKARIACTSTHHQMMRAGDLAVLVGVASEAQQLEYMKGNHVRVVNQKRGQDVEVLMYPEQRVLCFQPHPEFLGKEAACQRWYFGLIQEIL